MNSASDARVPDADCADRAWPLSARGRPAFTLIELMVVIAIIALLAALLFPALVGAREKAKNRRASAGVAELALAIRAYRGEYHKWPYQSQSVTDVTFVGNNFRVVRLLRGENDEGFNPKNKVFLSAPTNLLDNLGNYVDPWGVPYLICMDESDNGVLDIRFTGWHSNFFTGKLRQYGCTNYAPTRVDMALVGGENTRVTNPVPIREDMGVASFGDTTNLVHRSW